MINPYENIPPGCPRPIEPSQRSIERQYDGDEAAEIEHFRPQDDYNDLGYEPRDREE